MLPCRAAAWFVIFAGVLLQAGCLSVDKQPKQDGGTLPAKESASACVAVADTLAGRGHLTEAIKQLEMARQLDPKIDVSPRLARLHARRSNDQQALSEYESALKRHPQDAGLWNDLGYYQYERGNFAEAESALRKVVAIDPNHKKAWTNLGLALGQQGKADESLQAFEQASRPAEARCNLAFVMLTQGKKDEAKRLYKEAIELDPGLKAARAGLERVERKEMVKKDKPAEEKPAAEEKLGIEQPAEEGAKDE